MASSGIGPSPPLSPPANGDLGFLSGGEMIFTERTGAVKLRTGSGAIRTLADPNDVVVAGEGGMLGVAVDPNFATNRRVYTCFMSNAGGAVDLRIVKWRIVNAADRLHLREDIVTGIPVNTDVQLGRHSGCRPRFGPDGTGMAVDLEWTSVTDQGRLRVAVQGPDGALCVAVDAASGRILRIAPNS